jgi:hypothetical protein
MAAMSGSLSATSTPAAAPSVLPIDYAQPFANIRGVPLWLLPSRLSPQDHAAIESLHARGRAASHLADYAALAVLDDDQMPALHHRVICGHLDDLMADRYDELIVCTPPGSAKSTYTSHALASHFMGRWPRRSVILATHTADLSEKWSRKVRNTIASARHSLVFPDPGCQLSRDSTAVGRWATAAGGEFLAVGVGASILGFRADLACIDDPIGGFEQAQSITQLKKVQGWFETDLITRLKPRAKLVLICQRLSPNDLAGYLIERNRLNPTRRQKVLLLRMECEPDDCDPATGLDLLGRRPGERLWPEWFTPEQVEDARRDDFKWRTLYQQRPPSDEGSWVSPDDVQFRPTPQAALGPSAVTYGATDLALSVNTGDYTVHAVIASTVGPGGDEWDILHAERARVDTNASAERIVALCSAWRPFEWLIDDDNASKVFVNDVATRARAARVPVPWRPMPMRGQDKETRAAALRGQFKRRRIWMPADAPFAGWLTRELLTFPNALGQGVDDGVDCLGLFGRRLSVMASAAPAPSSSSITLKTVQNMCLEELYEDLPSTVTNRI